jgi:uncharacterized membrane protein
MGVIVGMVWATTSARHIGHIMQIASTPIFILGITTALSRLSMFSGVKFLGGLQTAILAIAEIGVALALAFLVLGERLTTEQWLGVGLLVSSLLLVRASDLTANAFNPGTLLMANIASQQFQWIAFHRAFSKGDPDKEQDVMAKITTSELESIRNMMGAESGPMDPYPINPTAAYTVDLSMFLKDSDNAAEDEDDPSASKAAAD